jgi:hypothetical protein
MSDSADTASGAFHHFGEHINQRSRPTLRENSDWPLTWQRITRNDRIKA